jgi:transcriptional regulator with XRE-family HTH domain
MIAFNMSSPVEVIADLSSRVKRRRIDLNLTQRDLAAKAGVSYSSLRLFEEAGKISLEALVKIAFVLGAEVEFGQLFPPQAPRTIDDVIDRPLRKRARKS